MTAFNEEGLRVLRRLAGRMIPPSEDYGVPGADDEAISADIVRTLAPAAETIAPLLQRLAADGLGARGDTDVDAALKSFLESGDAAMSQILLAVMQAYYRDDRVLASLGMEARAPFPKGFEVEDGDWSLLDPVRARPKLWRDAG